MQNSRASIVKPLFFSLVALAALTVWTGCGSLAVTSLTPANLPSNPSSIYTITARAKVRSPNVIRDSIRTNIVIDGRSYPMKKSDVGADLYEFDYQLPSDRGEIAYYIVSAYQVRDNKGNVFNRESYSPVMHGKIVGRYVLGLETSRGPVGARVSVLGRGFTPDDVLAFDGVNVPTAFDSSNALSFKVPNVRTDENYRVSLKGQTGALEVGTFRVDATAPTFQSGMADVEISSATTASALNVTPRALVLVSGETVDLTFSLASPVDGEDLPIDVTTDIPGSVIMPEVSIQKGKSSVTIPVKGGQAGSGHLFVRSTDGKEIQVSVTVR